MATATLVKAAPRASGTYQVVQAAPRRRSAPKPKPKHHARRAKGKLVSNLQNLGAFALAGYALGFLDKQGTAIPTIPVLGRAGTLAVGLHFLGKGNKLLQEASLAAAAIAGYEMGNAGKISGVSGVGGYVVPQVTGVASQV